MGGGGGKFGMTGHTVHEYSTVHTVHMHIHCIHTEAPSPPLPAIVPIVLLTLLYTYSCTLCISTPPLHPYTCPSPSPPLTPCPPLPFHSEQAEADYCWKKYLSYEHSDISGWLVHSFWCSKLTFMAQHCQLLVHHTAI